MANDELNNTGANERPRIDVDDDGALHDWAKKFDTTPQQIRDAVAAVGNQAADVEMHLKGSHATSNADQERRAAGQTGQPDGNR